MLRFLARTNCRTLAFAVLIALHLLASAYAVQSVVGLIAYRELPVVFPIVVGLLWGQAILLGLFLVLGTKWPLLRIGLAAGWFALVIYLAQPFFRTVIIPAMGGNPLPAILAMPLVVSALWAAERRLLGGVWIVHARPSQGADDGNDLRFSLRHIFALTLLAAVALAGVRIGRDSIEGAPQAILLGLLPATHILVVLPALSLWAALGGRHPVLRSASLTVFGLASIIGPLYIARVQPMSYWKLGVPVVMASLVVVATLLILRAIGWRCCVQGRSCVP
jgi:hypothetical protein